MSDSVLVTLADVNITIHDQGGRGRGYEFKVKGRFAICTVVKGQYAS